MHLNETFTDHNQIYHTYLNAVKDQIRDNAAKGRTKFATYLTFNPELKPSPFLTSIHPLAINKLKGLLDLQEELVLSTNEKGPKEATSNENADSLKT